MRLLFCMFLLILCFGPAAKADEIRLKDGTVYSGDILFWNDKQYALSVNGKAFCIDISDIQSLRLDRSQNFGPRPRKGRS